MQTISLNDDDLYIYVVATKQVVRVLGRRSWANIADVELAPGQAAVRGLVAKALGLWM